MFFVGLISHGRALAFQLAPPGPKGLSKRSLSQWNMPLGLKEAKWAADFPATGLVLDEAVVTAMQTAANAQKELTKAQTKQRELLPRALFAALQRLLRKKSRPPCSVNCCCGDWRLCAVAEGPYPLLAPRHHPPLTPCQGVTKHSKYFEVSEYFCSPKCSKNSWVVSLINHFPNPKYNPKTNFPPVSPQK